jgi:hypothetical protein
MGGLTRTDLTTHDKVNLAASALAQQGNHGVVTELAEAFGVSRPTVYSARQEGLEAPVGCFDAEVSGQQHASVLVDDAQLARAIVGLRVAGVNSLRAIETLLPVLYLGLHVSYGKIQGLLVEAERRAAAFNVGVDLSSIEAGALDEMFSQGDPVLAGVDLDSGFLFALETRSSRSGEDWKEVLSACRDQGLDLKVAVKDAALGIAAGVTAVFPKAQQRDDCFHALYEMSKVTRRLERKAYAAIAKEIEAERAVERYKRSLTPNRSQATGLRSALGHARKRCAVMLERHDLFIAAVEQVREGLEVADAESFTLRSPEEMERLLLDGARTMKSLDDGHCRKVGKYIENRAPGLVLYAGDLLEKLAALSETYGSETVRLCCIVLRLGHAIGLRHRAWRRREDRALLLGACAMLKHLVGDRAPTLLAAVRELFIARHRASSAIEGFNAALRPHVYVQKGASQGFLELFRAHHNLRTRRWGRHRGTSAYESMTGTPVDDWLTMLGYPPSRALH